MLAKLLTNFDVSQKDYRGNSMKKPKGESDEGKSTVKKVAKCTQAMVVVVVGEGKSEGRGE